MDFKTCAVKDGNVSDLMPALCIGISIIIVVSFLTFFNLPQNSLVAVIFPPWISEEESFQKIIELDATVVRFGLNGRVLIVKPASQEFEKQIKTVGAWAVVNPLGFGGCGTGLQITKKLHTGPLVYKK